MEQREVSLEACETSIKLEDIKKQAKGLKLLACTNKTKNLLDMIESNSY